MSLTIAAILISVVWLLGFGGYLYLASQHKAIEQELTALGTLLEEES